MKRVLIAITTAETVFYEVMESIHSLIIPEGVTTTLKVIHSYNVSDGRTELVKFAQQEKYDYIFFVDSDVILPNFALLELMRYNKPVINGTYARKEHRTIVDANPWTTLYRHDFSGMNKHLYGPFWMSNNELPREGIIPVDGAGLGCTLIDMKVFDAMPDVDWFFFAKEHDHLANGAYCLGEDLNFFRECIRHGFQPFAAGAVRCTHIGKYFYNLPQK